MNKIIDYLGIHPYQGDVGIEIEMESDKPFPINNPEGWYYTEDGSLRGYSMEYVTCSDYPVKKKDVKKVLDTLKNFLKPVPLNNSFRAGVHVHLNCQDLTIQQVASIAAVWYCFEDVLTKFCGETREGNFFCLRLKDAEAPLFALLESLEKGTVKNLNTDNLRYSALNLRSLLRHGTLEFRGMATKPNLENIEEWVNILLALKEYALNLDHRHQIAYEISFYGPETWTKNVLGEKLSELVLYEGAEKDILRCMRNVQELIYS